MAENMLTNRHDVEQAINDAMFEEATTFGGLGGTRFGAMTASTYGQAALQGRAIGGMLGGKDPRMRRQDLVDELMQEFPQPQTKDEFLATAKRAGELGLYEIQGQFLEVASQIPKKKIATEAQIDSLMGNLRLTQGADWMLDDYLIKNIVADFASYKEPEKSKYRTDVKAQFEDIINGYGAYLGTLDLSPQDVDHMMFTSEGKILNIARFKQYLKPISDSGNMFATHLYNNNHLILEALESGDVGGVNGNGLNKKEEVELLIPTTYVSEVHDASLGDNKNDKNQYTNISDIAKTQIDPPIKMEMWKRLGKIWNSFHSFGDIEFAMTQDEKVIENQDDEIQDWIKNEQQTGMTYFLSRSVEEFEKFEQNPRKYYIENFTYESIGKYLYDMFNELDTVTAEES